jgi:hypothetical protein
MGRYYRKSKRVFLDNYYVILIDGETWTWDCTGNGGWKNYVGGSRLRKQRKN